MSLARALTRRYKAGQPEEAPAALVRNPTLKRLDKPIDRSQISLPIELISSTNVAAYEAPDITNFQLHSPISAPSSASSFKSYEDLASSASSMTSPDISREPSPTVAEPIKPSYFPTVSIKAPSTPDTPQSLSFKENIAPSIPTRAPSHTKMTHHALARKRSMRLSNEPDETTAPVITPAPLSPSKKTHSSLELPVQSNSVDPLSASTEHPFGAELAQVKEVAEEFGVNDVRIWSEEEQYLMDNGFGRYTVEDYLDEIQPLFSKVYDVPSQLYSPTWL